MKPRSRLAGNLMAGKTAVCKPPLLGGTLARYEEFPVSRRDPRIRNFDSPLESRRVDRQPGFRPPFPDSVDRVRTSSKKCHPIRFLGMQCARQSADAQLFCDLSARFRRRFEHGNAVADLPAQFVFPIYTPRPAARGECAAPSGMIRDPDFTSRHGLSRVAAP
jgi:hypothetical protein